MNPKGIRGKRREYRRTSEKYVPNITFWCVPRQHHVLQFVLQAVLQFIQYGLLELMEWFHLRFMCHYGKLGKGGINRPIRDFERMRANQRYRFLH